MYTEVGFLVNRYCALHREEVLVVIHWIHQQTYKIMLSNIPNFLAVTLNVTTPPWLLSFCFYSAE